MSDDREQEKHDGDDSGLEPTIEGSNSTRPADELTTGQRGRDRTVTIDSGSSPTEIVANVLSPASPSFGDYEIISEIARGGMGVVYKARQHSLDRIVALKMILAGNFAGQGMIDRFRSEATAAAQLEHPGIVPIFEVGEFEGRPFFSMGFVDGESLAEKLRDGPIPTDVAARYTLAISEAVGFAHRHGVIHRDLKPANILIDSDDVPKITDFGLAKHLDSDDGLTETGQILGTPSYMSPEQARADGDAVGTGADIYSIGAILYYLLTGKPPFQSATTMDTLLQVLEHEPIPPRQLDPTLDEGIEAICMKCLQKQVDARYSSVEDLVEDLKRFIRREPVKAEKSSALNRAWRMVTRETRHREVLSLWGHVWIWQGAVLGVWLILNNGMLWLGIQSAYVHLIYWGAGVSAMISFVWWFRIRNGPSMSTIEKQLCPIWLMFVITAVLTGRINHLLGLETMELLPIVILQAGFAFGATAVLLGGSFYPLAAACAVVSIVMAAVPEIGPLVAGALIGPGLILAGRKYVRYS